MRHRLITAGLVLLAGAAAAVAGPLKQAWISPEAKWVVHVDVEAGVNSTIGRYIVEHRDVVQNRDLQRMRAETGVDPARDLQSITIYGDSCEPEDAVALIVSTGAVDSFLDKMRQQEPSYRKIEGERYTLESWKEHGSARFGFVRRVGEDQRLIMVSQDQKQLEAAIARTDPEGEAGARNSLLVEPPRRGSVLFVAAEDIGPKAARAKAVFVQKMQGMRLDVGEAEGEIYAIGAVATGTEADARNMQQLLQGALALGRMLANERPELAPLMELGDSMQFSTSDTAVKVSLSYDAAKALDMLKAMEARSKETVGAPGGQKHGDGDKP